MPRSRRLGIRRLPLVVLRSPTTTQRRYLRRNCFRPPGVRRVCRAPLPQPAGARPAPPIPGKRCGVDPRTGASPHGSSQHRPCPGVLLQDIKLPGGKLLPSRCNRALWSFVLPSFSSVSLFVEATGDEGRTDAVRIFQEPQGLSADQRSLSGLAALRCVF